MHNAKHSYPVDSLSVMAAAIEIGGCISPGSCKDATQNAV